MADEEFLKVNPNTADEETLRQLPGIGRSLAQKIVASRPFSGVQDLQNIRGLGKVAFERIEPHLSFVEPEVEEQTSLDQEEQDNGFKLEQETVEEGEESIFSPDGRKEVEMAASEVTFETKEDAQPEKEETLEKVAEKKEPITPARLFRPGRTFSRSETLWLMVAAGLATLILSVLVNMAIIGGINGTLDFNRLQTVRQLESELSEVQGSLETLSSNVSVLEERLTPLEGLTGRMITVEGQVDAIQGGVTDALDGVESMQVELEGLSDETARLTGRVDRFDTFLDGLRRIMTELFAAPSAESMPQQ